MKIFARSLVIGYLLVSTSRTKHVLSVERRGLMPGTAKKIGDDADDVDEDSLNRCESGNNC